MRPIFFARPLLALLVALVGGCVPDSPQPSSLSPAPASSPSPSTAAHAPAVPQVVEPPVARTAPPRRAGAADTTAGVTSEQLNQVFEEAVAASVGEANCAGAFSSSTVMVEGVRRLHPERADIRPPDRESFMEVCESMPETVQRCLVFAYQREHGDECRLAFRDLTAEQRAALRRISFGP